MSPSIVDVTSYCIPVAASATDEKELVDTVINNNNETETKNLFMVELQGMGEIWD
jgi:hypothetical protein